MTAQADIGPTHYLQSLDAQIAAVRGGQIACGYSGHSLGNLLEERAYLTKINERLAAIEGRLPRQ